MKYNKEKNLKFQPKLVKSRKQCYTADKSRQEEVMKTEFDITLNSSDMYRFSMYHAYTTSQGILSILIAALCLFMSVRAYGTVTWTYTILYAGFGILFLVYIPVHLYLRSKQRLLASEELRNALHYLVDDSGIHTSQNDASADAPWEAVYKLIETKRNILIYSSRVNAYIIPKSQIEKEYRELIQIAAAHLPKYRLKTK